MKSKLIILFVLFIALTATAQVSTKTGIVKFEASTPNFEPVAATNSATSAILKEDGSVVVLSLIKGFQFKKALMQKHFNSKKWVNSQEFPKTKFVGAIANFDLESLTAESKEYKINGKLTFHGVTKEISTLATINKVDAVVSLQTKFAVKVADYGIVVKSKLAAKIAEKVNVDIALTLK